MPKSTLFIVGAGCSKNYDHSRNGIQKLVSPTNNDFFKMAKIVLQVLGVDEASEKPLMNLLKRICLMKGLRYNNTYEFLSDSVLDNLEDIMTSIEIHSSLFESRNVIWNNRHPYNVLVELIAFTISHALKGGLCSSHRELARLMTRDDVIVDFNYDLLLDDALRSEKKLDDYGYEINFARAFQEGNWVKPEEKVRNINILKLHGSFNWLKCIDCSSILLLRDPKIALPKFSVDSLSQIKCPRCDEKGSLKRLIIPPIQTKEYNVEPYNLLWKIASKRISRVSRIAFLGYSFSNTDFATTTLLRQIYNYVQVEKLGIHIMNPDRDTETRLKAILPGIQTPTFTNDLGEFVRFYKKW
jgi:hypothetical protein